MIKQCYEISIYLFIYLDYIDIVIYACLYISPDMKHILVNEFYCTITDTSVCDHLSDASQPMAEIENGLIAINLQ